MLIKFSLLFYIHRIFFIEAQMPFALTCLSSPARNLPGGSYIHFQFFFLFIGLIV